MTELTVHLDTKSKMPMYEQLYAYIKAEIQSNQMRSGEKLPSARSLCAYLGVSRSTVDLAYEQLLSEGYIESRPRSGYYVCEIRNLYHLSASNEPVNVFKEEEKEQVRIDFSPFGIDLDSFPYDTWRKINRRTLIDDNKELFQLGDPAGDISLRETICRYLHEARGVNCRPEQLILGAGNDYLLLLITMILGEGQKIVMEDPTYQHAMRIFKQAGYEVQTAAMDASGLMIESLRKSGGNIAYVMPSHQFPLGIVMPIRRRQDLLSWAEEEEDRYIIEDDYDSEFRYKGKPIPALQGSDRSGKVIYIGTFSKSIAPAIRISYMVLPEKLAGEHKQELSHFSSTVSRLDQTSLNMFLSEGYYERHLNRMRGIYSRKHDLLLGRLKPLQKICRIHGDQAGVHLLLEFMNGMTEEEAIKRAEAVGVKVYPLSQYYTDRESSPKSTVILGYATLSENEIEEGIDLLKNVWNE